MPDIRITMVTQEDPLEHTVGYSATTSLLKPTIILADDDEDDRIFFEDSVRRHIPDANLVMVGSGYELLTQLKSLPAVPDVIVVDVNMPGYTGIECLDSIRHDPALATIPVVIISSSTLATQVDEAFQKKANRYVVKPQTLNGLRKAIKEILTANWQELQVTDRSRFVYTY